MAGVRVRGQGSGSGVRVQARFMVPVPVPDPCLLSKEPQLILRFLRHHAGVPHRRPDHVDVDHVQIGVRMVDVGLHPADDLRADRAAGAGERHLHIYDLAVSDFDVVDQPQITIFSPISGSNTFADHSRTRQRQQFHYISIITNDERSRGKKHQSLELRLSPDQYDSTHSRRFHPHLIGRRGLDRGHLVAAPVRTSKRAPCRGQMSCSHPVCPRPAARRRGCRRPRRRKTGRPG